MAAAEEERVGLTPFLASSRRAGAAKVGHQVMPTIETAGGPFGERLLPQVVDTYASIEPERVYASIPWTTDVNDGFRDVSMTDLASAINHVAWMLEGVDGKPSAGRFETVAYMGASDIRYAIFFLAGIKVGYVVSGKKASNFRLCTRDRRVVLVTCLNLSSVDTVAIRTKFDVRKHLAAERDQVHKGVPFQRHDEQSARVEA